MRGKMIIIKIIALIIFIMSCVVIYHNTNSFEPKVRILYIVIGMIIMYIITTIICKIDTNGIEVKSEKALNETLSVIKMLFTPINTMIVFSSIGNVFGKVKDGLIETDRAGKRLLIILIAIIIIFIFETNYIKDFISGVLGG